MDLYTSSPTIDHRTPLQLRSIIEQIATTDDPELLVAFHEQADAAGELFRDNVHDLIKYVKQLEALNEATDREIERLQELKKERAIRAERLQDLSLRWMLSVGETAIMWHDHTIRAKFNPVRVIVEDDTDIPEAYWRTKTTVERAPDKVAIKSAIENGLHISGCKLERTTKLEIK